MAFNPAPSGYFPGINVGAVISSVTGVFIPWSDLENFNTSTSGDIRQLFYAMNEAVFNVSDSLPIADVSTQMNLTRSQSFPSSTTLRRRYVNTFNVSFSGLDFNMSYESGV